MTSASQVAYQALRDHLNSLLSPTHPDQPLAEVPAALRPSLEAFLRGKTEYQDEAGRRMIYAYDLAGLGQRPDSRRWPGRSATPGHVERGGAASSHPAAGGMT